MKNLLKKYVILLFALYLFANIFGFFIPFLQILSELNSKFSLLAYFDILSSILVGIIFLTDRKKFNLSTSMLVMLTVLILFNRNIGICLALITCIANSDKHGQ